MPKLSTDTETTVELAPETQAALHSALSMYTGLKEQIELLEGLMDEERAKMQALLEEAGTDKALHDGYHVSIIRGTSSSLDKKKLIAQGVTEAMIERAATIKPKRPYVAVRKAGDKGDE